MRRGVVVGGLIVALAAAIWLWWGHDAPTATSESQASGSDHASFKAFDPKDPLAKLRWLGQRGVAARRIAGIVLMDGAPVAGATVVLGSTHATAGLIAAPHVVSDATGHFDFGPQVATSYVVSADLPHRTGAIVDVDVRDPTLRTDQLELVLHACDASIHGTIRDGGGVIGRARVTQVRGSILTGSSATADDTGNYELCVPVGASEVIAHADGYAEAHANVTAYGALRHDFSLVPEAIVVGHVVSAADHRPVAGAIVTLRSEDLLVAQDSVPQTTVSDASGAFSLSGVRPGRQALTATADRMRTPQPVHVIAALRPGDDVKCELVAGHTVSGTVTDHKVGVPGLMVWLTEQDNRGWYADPAVTQADGSFVLEGVAPGDFKVVLANHQLKTDAEKVHVGNSDVEGVVVEIERFGTITGRITHDGKPVEGAEVSARPSNTTSDRNGHYELRDLPSGTYEVNAQSRRIGAFANAPSVTIGNGETRTVDVEMNMSGSIAGIVVDQNDAPVSGAQIRFSLMHGRDGGNSITAEDGSFIANALSGGGSYAYAVQGRSGVTYPPADGKRSRPIEVHDARTHVTDVRIRVRVDRLSIAGHVIDASGHPAPDVVVAATSRVQGESLKDTTDASGAFEIRDVAKGQYDLKTNALGGNGKDQIVAAGRTDVVIQLGEAGSIEGTLEHFTTSPTVWVSSASQWFTATVDGKSFQVRDVPTGSYDVVATSSEAQGLAKVIVASGQVVTVLVRGEGLGAVAATLVDAGGHGLPNVTCELSAQNRGSRETTDASGRFAVDRLAVGEAMIYCYSGATFAQGRVTVVANDTARITMTIAAVEPHRHANSGLRLEFQPGDVISVDQVVPGGPAERAGILVDDIILEVDGVAASGAFGAGNTIESHPTGTVVKLTLERADKQLTVNLTLD